MDGPADNSRLGSPRDVACDSKGRIYFVDCMYSTIRMYDPLTKYVYTVAGEPGVEGCCDGDAGRCRFKFPTSISLRERRLTHNSSIVEILVCDTGKF